MSKPVNVTPTQLHRRRASDEAQWLAELATRLRPVLIYTHRRSLPRVDLEDAYGQAILELLLRVSHGATFASTQHATRALRQRFEQRIADRHRAIHGRSQAARTAGRAITIDDVTRRLRAHPDCAQEVLVHEQLRELLHAITALPAGQRAALTCELAGVPPAAARAAHGWSSENHRKLRQRARHRLGALKDAA